MSAATWLRSHAGSPSPFPMFLVAGVLTTLLYFLVYNVARTGMAPVAANVLAWAVGLGVGFLLNARITFRGRTGDWRAQLTGFLAIYISSAVMTSLALHAFVSVYGQDEPVLENALLVVLQALLVVGRYVALKTWVFRSATPAEVTASAGAPELTTRLRRHLGRTARALRKVVRLRRVDLAFGGGIAILGAAVAAWVLQSRGLGEFYQKNFEPAVRFACGQGLAAYAEIDPALQTFLASKDGSYQCSSAPGGERMPLVFGQAAAIYLQLSVGLVWRVFGVSWGSLVVLFALLAGMTAAALYGLARQLLPKMAAALVAALLLLSPLHLAMLPQLRDYSKAPFLLSAFLLLSWLIRRPLERYSALGLSGAAGVVVGIGYGFRADVLLVVPLFVTALVLFWPGGVRRDLLTRVLSALLFLIAFALTSAPVRAGLPEGGNTAHWAVQGLGTRFTAELGLEQDLYDVGYVYNDTYATSLVNAHAYRLEGFRRPVRLASPEAEHYGMDLLLDTARVFPADLLARGYAATLRIIELPIHAADRAAAVSGVPALAQLSSVVSANKWLTWLLLLGALLLGAARNLRLALLAGTSVLYLGAVSALQFNPRHIFHLEAVTVLAAAYLCVALVRVVPRARHWRLRHVSLARVSHSARRCAVPNVVLCIALLASTLGLLLPARAYQQDAVGHLIENVKALPREALSLTRVDAGGLTRLALPERTPSGAAVWMGSDLVQSAYLVARFDRTGCDAPFVPYTWRYESPTAYTDYTRTGIVTFDDQEADVIEVYLLALRDDSFALRGLEVPRSMVACVDSLAVVRETDELPLLANLALSDQWSQATRHQTFAQIEKRREALPPAPQLLTSSPDATVDVMSGRELDLSVDAAPPELVATAEGWRYSGQPETATAYLAVSPGFPCRAGQQVTLTGNLIKGEVTLGLQQDDRWVDVLKVPEPGAFVTVLTPPSTAQCRLVMANASDSTTTVEVEVDRARVQVD